MWVRLSHWRMCDETRSDNAEGGGLAHRSRLIVGPGRRARHECGGGSAMPATVGGRPRPLTPVHRVVGQIGRRTYARIGIVAGTALAAVLAVHAYGRQYVFFD